MLPQTTVAQLVTGNGEPFRVVDTDGADGCRTACRDEGRECYAWAVSHPLAPGRCSLWRFPVGIGYPMIWGEGQSGYCTGGGMTAVV